MELSTSVSTPGPAPTPRAVLSDAVSLNPAGNPVSLLSVLSPVNRVEAVFEAKINAGLFPALGLPPGKLAS